MADHSSSVNYWPHIIKPLAVAGSTFAITTLPLIADGKFSLMDIIADCCAVIGAVSALYLKRPESQDSTNV